MDIIKKSTEDVRNYLAQNPNYQELLYPTTLMIAGGKIRQKKLLENSPKPNQSKYFPNRFTIELQAEEVIDEIHVHWRDYRFAMPRNHFNIIAEQFEKAKSELLMFEKKNIYKRKPHHNRSIEDFSEERKKFSNYDGVIQGEIRLKMEKIRSRYENIFTDFKPDRKFINSLVDLFNSGERVFPILLSTEKDGSHIVIDGNHRYYAALKSNQSEIGCIVTDLTFKKSNLFRKAEGLLKQFDLETDYKYNTSNFNKEFVAYKLGYFYRDHFYKSLKFFSVKNRTKKYKRKILNSSIKLLEKLGLKSVLKKTINKSD